jgi:hypothetical protein
MMAFTDEEMRTLEATNLRQDIILKVLQEGELEHRIANRRDAEVQQVLADIKLKARQAQTEIWKVVILTVGVTAAIVQAANVFFGG